MLGAMKTRKILWAYLFLTPQLIFYLAFTIYPMVMSYVYVLYDWTGIGPLTRFVGLDNFRRVMDDPYFWKAFKNSFIYMSGKLVLEMPLGLLMALCVNSVLLRWKVFIRTIFFIPVVSTAAIVGVTMKIIFGNDKALFNNMLQFLGVIDKPVPWLLQSTSAMVILIIIGAWLHFGMTMIYWLASLQALPREIYDAAKVDGASVWQTFWRVTWPLLLPAAVVILMLNVVSGFGAFDLAMTLTGGGPFFATTTIDMYIYDQVFGGGIPRIGIGSAAGMIFGLTVFVMTIGLAGLNKAVRNRSQATTTERKAETA